jgi:hypothetical protein
MDNLIIPNQYTVKWLDVVLFVAKLGLERMNLLNSDVRRELFAVYYEGFDINKDKGFIVNEMVVKNKPNLYMFLTGENDYILVNKPTIQKRLIKEKK